MAERTKPITITMTVELLSCVDALATANHMSRSATIDKLLRAALKDRDVAVPPPANPFDFVQEKRS